VQAARSGICLVGTQKAVHQGPARFAILVSNRCFALEIGRLWVTASQSSSLVDSAPREIVRFDNVGLRYGVSAETLSDISFTLTPGSFYFVAGPSGAGKTSLLKLLYLALRPSRGHVTLFGQDMVALARDRLPGFRRRIGVVFQDFRLVPHLSAFDNVALPLRIAGVTERDLVGPVREMLDWVDLMPRADARPATLSGGEQQRVAIARAVIARPELLVADEPTGNVDPDMAVRLLQLFEGLNRMGTTVVVATHDVHLMNRVQGAHLMRVAKGRLADPTGALRFPPAGRATAQAPQ
jgi:cell division transport system ATP-binding protein